MRYKERIRTGKWFVYNFEENLCSWDTMLDRHCQYNKEEKVYFGENRSQCTWLTDKNWKEMREADIIKTAKWELWIVKFWYYLQDWSGGEYWPIDCIWFYTELLWSNYPRRYYQYSIVWIYWNNEVIWNVRENKDLLNQQY